MIFYAISWVYIELDDGVLPATYKRQVWGSPRIEIKASFLYKASCLRLGVQKFAPDFQLRGHCKALV